MSKYPVEVIVRLEESKDPAVPWDMESLRKAISHYITIQENVQRYCGDTNVKGQHLQRFCFTNTKGHSMTKQVRPFKESPSSSAEVLTAGSLKVNKGSSKPSLPCIFCKGEHFNDMCNQYPYLDDRKKRLSQKGRCFICLKLGHTLRNCMSSQKKSCCHCGQKGYHNRCFCPVRRILILWLLLDRSEESLESPTDMKFVQKSDQPERSLAVDSGTTPMLLAYGEKVLLQTATVPIQGFDSSFTVSAHVLLDSASQRTFMTDSLAKQLGLKPEQKELLSITTFGAGKATNIDTYVVKFNVKLKDGSSMLLFANVLK